MEDITRKMEAAVREKLGAHCIETIDRVSEEGQFAFATDEPDRGESVKGDWLDTIREALRSLGIGRYSVMPFPVRGKLVYVVAGLRRHQENGNQENSKGQHI